MDFGVERMSAVWDGCRDFELWIMNFRVRKKGFQVAGLWKMGFKDGW